VLEVAPLPRELIPHILKLRMPHPANPEQDRVARLLVSLLVEARSIDLALPLPADRRARSQTPRPRPCVGKSNHAAAVRSHLRLRSLRSQTIAPASRTMTITRTARVMLSTLEITGAGGRTPGLKMIG
jgi:hypothetical protein